MTSTDSDLQPQEQVSLFGRLRAMRTDLDEAEQKLLDDPDMSGVALAAELARINAAHADINLEEGRLNEDAIKIHENDPKVLELVQKLGASYDELAKARAELKKATAKAKEAVEVIGKVDKVLKVFGGLALKIVLMVG